MIQFAIINYLMNIITMHDLGDLKDTLFFHGEGDSDYAKSIAQHLGVKFALITHMHFHNSEYRCKIEQSVSGKRIVFISQCTERIPDATSSVHLTVNERIMQLILTLSAFSASGAKEIIVVMPHLVYSRQDKKDDGRVPIGSSVLLRLIRDVVAQYIPLNLISADLHAGQTQGVAEALHIRFDNLYSEPYMVEWIRDFMKRSSTDSNSVVIVSPDAGGVKRAERVAEKLNVGCVTMSKTRAYAGVVSKIVLNGDVKDKVCVLVDDMADTCGTAAKAAEELKKNGAVRVIMLVCHGILSSNAIDKINSSEIDMLVVMDTVDKQFTETKSTYGIGLNEETPVRVVTDKIHIVSISWLFAMAIYGRLTQGSVSYLFKEKIMISDSYLESETKTS